MLFFVLNVFGFVAWSNIRLMDDKIYNRLLKAIDAKEMGVLFAHVSCGTAHTCPAMHAMLCREITCSERKVIFPRIGRVNTIVQFSYKTYKGEGARKLQKRILMSYAGLREINFKLFKTRTLNIARKTPSLEINQLSNQ